MLLKKVKNKNSLKNYIQKMNNSLCFIKIKITANQLYLNIAPMNQLSSQNKISVTDNKIKIHCYISKEMHI